MSKYKSIFDENIKRVEGLNELYNKLKKRNERDSNTYKLTDSLRAGVVFLHSAFEEYFRCVLVEWLPVKANEETFKQIPIALRAGKKPERIFLNELAKYKEKTVNDIICESIDEHMKLQSFNNEESIRRWCSKIGIDLSDFSKMREIDKAVHRRHKIVHEADMKKDNENETGKLTGITSRELGAWTKAYKDLVDVIESQIEEWNQTSYQN